MKVFVSRFLEEYSPIYSCVNSEEVLAQSLIDFAPLSFERPQSDWIFFYSRNAVRYFFINDNYALYPYLWACMSHGTADELSKYVMDIPFIGNGKPTDVATQFQAIRAIDESVCYIKAENSLDSIHKIIIGDQDFSIPAYSNRMVTEIPSMDFDILIFTSPMNVAAWFGQRSYNGQKVIAIGETTAQALKSKGVETVIISKEPSEHGIAEELRKILV